MTQSLRVSDEVAGALAEGHPIVAFETSVLAQGLPPPRNAEAAAAISHAVHAVGALIAWIAVLDGAVRVGLSEVDLALLMEPGRAGKVARRDVSVAVASGAIGATTVSAAMWAADRSGIGVVATGGIGGVHASLGSGSADVSADLLELAATPVLVVCSGPKSIVDPAATAERLDELGVATVGYRCDRLPFFVVRECDVPLEHTIKTPAEAAAILRRAHELGMGSAVLLCNPVPEQHALDAELVRAAIASCEDRRRADGVRGKDVTPYLLSCLAERTDGLSLEANLALLASNAALAAEVAVALAT
jgi:pseudouridylate synthase